ncbi:aminodeoxychorismate synthase component I [Novosphingobium sediminicola]|uniref:Probable branched-chain-amino-acid aminotransferase n=1 Tax=Novosphingobium sediminicola TaxID=563162 RepID=A0A7W6CJG5_9SPHN|nr:aminodeoxychorismate synthase component I [Novosphingobium sediminicola]MBB3957002.1 para-aminobenzoate synthetase/4-amino-4-deoxychorismate lyase [Novosphingobium sediminicola]
MGDSIRNDRPYNAPFVLLDDARRNGASGADEGRARLYTNPREIIIARRPEEVAPALARIEALIGQGYACAGHFGYEAGLALEPRLAQLAAARSGADGPLVWMGAFDGWQDMSGAQVSEWLAGQAQFDPAPRIGPMVPAIGPGAYTSAFDHIAEAIRAGDIYQANFTFPLAGPWAGDPLALYAQLRSSGGGGHGGILFDGQYWLLSLSPELFFEAQGRDLRAKPMKGTRPRGATPDADAALARELVESIKDRSENLMILDLMRNDIARVSDAGSVRVDAPFAIESYPTVHQMVSTVTARLEEGRSLVDVIRALFPCGSVTGAPKIRAMELIHAHERDPRGIYCGSLGHIDPPDALNSTGSASFNVAIRSLRLAPDGKAVLGVGSAVVADSVAIDEWRECLVKGGFVHQPAPDKMIAAFDLIETMAFDPEIGVPLLEAHLERMKESAGELGFSFDRHGARNAIHALCFQVEKPSRLRLVLGRSGAVSVEVGPLPAPLDRDAPVPVIALPIPLDTGDWRLRHKTSDRWFYDAGLRAARAEGAKEAIFVRDDGLITEGCFTSVFVERDGVLLTPPLALGLLPGVLRRTLIEEGRAREAELTLEDLEDGFFIGNGLRGLMRAQLCV